jgi:hypothetical protein
MAQSNNVCYYGRHIGCPYADDPTCRRCAERLTHAVEWERHQAALATEDVTSERQLWFDNNIGIDEHRGAFEGTKFVLASLFLRLLTGR